MRNYGKFCVSKVEWSPYHYLRSILIEKSSSTQKFFFEPDNQPVIFVYAPTYARYYVYASLIPTFYVLLGLGLGLESGLGILPKFQKSALTVKLT